MAECWHRLHRGQPGGSSNRVRIDRRVDHRAGQHATAVDEYLSPALGNLGICHLVNNQLVKSRDCLTRALKVDPDYTPAKLALAQLESIEQGGQKISKEIRSTIHGQHQRIS